MNYYWCPQCKQTLIRDCMAKRQKSFCDGKEVWIYLINSDDKRLVKYKKKKIIGVKHECPKCGGSKSKVYKRCWHCDDCGFAACAYTKKDMKKMIRKRKGKLQSGLGAFVKASDSVFQKRNKFGVTFP